MSKFPILSMKVFSMIRCGPWASETLLDSLFSQSPRISTFKLGADTVTATTGWMMMFLGSEPPLYGLVAGRKQTDDNMMRHRKGANCTPDNQAKNTGTHIFIIFNIYCFYTATMVRRTGLNVTVHVHYLFC